MRVQGLLLVLLGDHDVHVRMNGMNEVLILVAIDPRLKELLNLRPSSI